jgi:O-antigen/teichoic acid export membrane protein
MSTESLIARNAAYLMVGQAMSWSLGLVFVLIVPRSVGAYQWGEWSLAWAITGVVSTLAGLGLGTLVIKDVSRDPSRAADYVGAALTSAVIMAGPFVAIIAGFAALAHYPTHTRVVIGLVTLAALVMFLATPITSALLALQKMHLNTLGTIISNGLVSLAAVLLVKLAAVGITTISLAALCGALAAAGVQIYGLRRHTRVWPNLNWRLIGHMIVGGLPYWGSGLFLTVYVWIDSVMLSVMTSTTEVGWYGAATRIISTMGFLPYIITMAVFPALSHGYKHDRGAMGRLAQVSLRLLVSLGLPLVVGTAIVGPKVVLLVFGWAFAPAGMILVVLSLTLLPMFVATLINGFLIAADRQVVWTWVMLASCILNPAINLVSISVFERAYHNGALGAAFALLITDTLIGVAALVLLPHELWTRVRAITPALARAAAAAAIMGVFVWLLRDRFVLLPVGLGVIVFAIAALVLRVFTREDVSPALALLARLNARWRRSRGAPPALQSIPVAVAGDDQRHEPALAGAVDKVG